MNVSVAQIDSTSGGLVLVKSALVGNNTLVVWKNYLQALIEAGDIDEPGFYMTWCWEQNQCSKCKTQAGVNVALNEVYTIIEDANGELIVKEGVYNPSTTPKLVTWPPK